MGSRNKNRLLKISFTTSSMGTHILGRRSGRFHDRTSRKEKHGQTKSVEEDIIAENQRLRERNEYLEAELEYLKKLDALVREREQRSGKNPKQ